MRGVGKKERAGFVLYFDDLEALAKTMDDAKLGAFIVALSRYARESVEPTFTDDNSRMAFGLLRTKIDRDREHYAEISEKRAKAALKRVDEKEQLKQMLQMQPYGTGTGNGNGNVKEYGEGYGMSVDPRIVAFERMKQQIRKEHDEHD